MSINYNPRIVTDGLVLLLDAGNAKSTKNLDYSSGWSGPTAISTSASNSFDGSTSTFTGAFGGNFSATYTFQEPLITSSTVRINVTLGASISQVGSNTNIVRVNGIDVTQKLKDAAAYAPAFEWIDVTTEVGGVFETIQINGVGGVANSAISAIEVDGQILQNSWTDISRNGNDGTLINGPTFDSANGGSLVFDGVDDYVNGNLGTLNAPFTLEIFGKFNNTSQFNYEYFGSIGDFSVNEMISISKIGTRDLNSSYHGFMYVYSGSGDGKKTNIDLRTTNYQHLVVVLLSSSPYIKVYKNGVEGSMVDSLTAPINTNGNYRIGTWANSTWWLNGNISSFKVYNRALSEQEIKQNFNALRGRFGI